MSRPSTAKRRALGLAARCLISVGLLGAAVWSNREQLAEVAARRPDLTVFVLAFALYFSGVLLAYVRWFVLVRALSLPLGMLESIRLGLVGTLFNLVIPGAIGGDFVKAAYFLRTVPGRKAQAGASVAIDRVVGLLGLFVLTTVVGLLGWRQLDAPVRRLVLFATGLTAVIVLMLVVAFTPSLFRMTVRRLAGKPRLAAALHELVVVGTAYRSRLGTVCLSIGLAAATHVLNVAAFYCVSRALFPAVPDLAEHFLIVPLVLFSTAIPLPFGALGVSEQVSFGLFRLVAYDGGAVAMMGFRVLQYTACLIALATYLTSRREAPAPAGAIPGPHEDHARREPEGSAA